VDLNTHITDIVNCLKYENLRDVNLVGHSYGGMVVTGAADRERERIRTLTYLDALVPKDNQAVFDLMSPERAEINRTMAKEEGDGWRLPSPLGDFWKLTDPDDIAWFNGSCTDHPLAAFEQRIRLTHADGPVDRRVYIWASGFAPSPFEKFAAETRDDPAWTYREIQSGHMPMISHPVELTALLEEVTDQT
jgi:pimeloyl-ACP methyl ester carboxylesterase